MSKDTKNLARPGDRVYRVSCCGSAVLVRESAIHNWECTRCSRGADPSALFVFDRDMELVELSMKEARSYRDA